MRPIPITLRLLLSYLLVAALPLIGMSLWYVQAYENSLRTTMLDNMDAIANKKADQIETFLSERVADAAQLSRSPLVREAVMVFGQAYRTGGLHSVAYRAAEKMLHDELAERSTLAGYKDLLLMDRDGNVVFSMAKEADLGTNLRTGPWRTTQLAQGFDNAIHGLELSLTRFAPYAPSGQRTVAFMVAPIRVNNQTLGVLALRMNLERLAGVVQDRAGLGASGETVLAQRDGDQVLFAGSLRHVPDAAFRHRLSLSGAPLPLRQSLAGISGHAITLDYADKEVVAAWRYLPGLHWGMVAKVEAEEALAPAVRLRRLTYGTLVLFLALSGAIAYGLGRRLSRPIIDLTDAAEGIAQGDLMRRAQATGSDELGRMAISFNAMADKLAKAQRSLEAKVEARTAELQRQTERLVEAQHAASIGNWELNLVSGRLFWSGEMFSLFEIDSIRFEPSYEIFLNVIHPEDRDRVNQAYTDSLVNRASYEIEHRLLMPDGRVKWVNEHCQTYYDKQGKPLRSTGTVQNVTEQKLAETNLRQALDLNQHYLDTVQTIMLALDSEGRITMINRAGCQLLGYQNDELLGRNWFDACLPQPEGMEKVYPVFLKLIEGQLKGVDSFENQVLLRDSSLRMIAWCSASLTDAQGRVFGVIASGEDITERKQAELRQQQANRELQIAKEHAEAANRAKSEFLANMSHEIRTPMNAVMGLTQLVLDSKLQPQQENYLRKVLTSSRSLLGILNDILDYSKIEAGRMEIERVPLRVEEVLRDTADLFSAHLEEKGLEIFFDITADVPLEVLGDPLRLSQVLNNLVGNATKFTEQGEIDIQVRAEPIGDDLLLHLAVRDTGIGFDQQQAQSLLQPFTQADSSVTRKYGGTGLGLSICHKLVTLMGGEISASGAVGQGATFSFSIRVGRSPTAAPVLDLQQLTGLKVLVVDDQETSRTILKQLLEAWRMEAQTVASGAEAMACIEEASRNGQPFDVILLDWRMPGMSGLDVARQLGKDASSAPMVMIMITMHDRDALLREAGSIRLDGVLTKPVVPSHLFDILVNRRKLSGQGVEAEVGSGAAAVRFDGARILLVEDNAINQEIATAFLEQRGALVTLASHGAEAVERVQEQAFDAVLMDLHMPGMDGLEATRRIRALPAGLDLPIIAMTAAVLQEDRDRCTEAGMVDFVGKPIDPEELIRCLQQWLQAYAQQTAESAIVPAPLHDLQTLPGFDLADALQRLGGDPSLLTRLLRGFAQEQRNALAQLDVLLQSQAGGKAAELLHALRGAAANLGSTELALAAGKLEQEIREGKTPQSRAAFNAALESALAAINDAFPEPASKETAPIATDLPALAALLVALVPYLREGELIPEDLTQSLHRLASQSTENKLLTQLIRKIDHFDHEGALSDIMQLAATLNIEIAS